MGKIPALVDGPVTLWESNAINRLLDQRGASARPTTRKNDLFHVSFLRPLCGFFMDPPAARSLP
jgi:glutathione S-transferase